MRKIISVLLITSLITSLVTGQKNLSENQLKLKELEKETFLSKKNTISFSPFNILFKQIQLSYERRLGKQNSIMLIGSLLHDRDGLYNSSFGYTFSLAAELHYRKYIYNSYLRKKKNPSSQNTFGLYVSPFAGYQYLEREMFYDYGGPNYDLFSNSSSQNAIQLGAVTGINFNLLRGRLSLDFYGGFAEKLSFVNGASGAIHYFQQQNNSGILQFDVFGIIPKANMQIGFNF